MISRKFAWKIINILDSSFIEKNNNEKKKLNKVILDILEKYETQRKNPSTATTVTTVVSDITTIFGFNKNKIIENREEEM